MKAKLFRCFLVAILFTPPLFALLYFCGAVDDMAYFNRYRQNYPAAKVADWLLPTARKEMPER